MQKKRNDSTQASPPPTLPTFVLSPAMRCYHHDRNSRRIICGELATHRRRGKFWFDDAFFCPQHALEDDEPIEGDLIFRRFRFNVDVILAGASLWPDVARSEALQRLEAAIASVGGILDVQQVGTAYGRSSAVATPGRRANTRAVDRE